MGFKKWVFEKGVKWDFKMGFTTVLEGEKTRFGTRGGLKVDKKMIKS
jgi:hypothetical protein